jgi:hypothetical protein
MIVFSEHSTFLCETEKGGGSRLNSGETQREEEG